jgi:uncharacterized damage-inducible protein DinB
MNIPQQIAKHLRDVFFGKNWTCSTIKEQMQNISLEQAKKQVNGLNSILTLLQHSAYYIPVQINVLEGKPLVASDAESFKLPTIENEVAWQNYIEQIYSNVEKLAILIENLPEEKLAENFTDEKYGNYYRNLNGMIEHTHYHLGQIAIIKKIVQQEK